MSSMLRSIRRNMLKSRYKNNSDFTKANEARKRRIKEAKAKTAMLLKNKPEGVK